MAYQGYKYKFSTKAPVNLVSEEIIKKREEEIFRLKDELMEYKIFIKDLAFDNPSYDIRNKILNTSYFIIENIEIYNYLIDNKRFPLRELLKTTPIEREFLETWKQYIIVYFIILSDPTFKYIQEYLQVVEAVRVLGSEEIIENLPVEEHRGVLLQKGRIYSILLTSKGEFIKIKSNSDNKVGEEVLGKEAVSIRKYKTQIAIFFGLLACLFLIVTYKYKSIDKTIIIETTSTITLEVNSSNKVVNSYSKTDKGEEMLRELGINNSNVDLALKNILDYANNNEMIPAGSIVVKVTGNALEYGILEETSEYITENKLQIKFNNSGDENKLSE